MLLCLMSWLELSFIFRQGRGTPLPCTRAARANIHVMAPCTALPYRSGVDREMHGLQRPNPHKPVATAAVFDPCERLMFSRPVSTGSARGRGATHSAKSCDRGRAGEERGDARLGVGMRIRSRAPARRAGRRKCPSNAGKEEGRKRKGRGKEEGRKREGRGKEEGGSPVRGSFASGRCDHTLSMSTRPSNGVRLTFGSIASCSSIGSRGRAIAPAALDDGTSTSSTLAARTDSSSFASTSLYGAGVRLTACIHPRR